VVAAIVILFLLVGLIGVATWLTVDECDDDRKRINGLQRQVAQLSAQVDAQSAEVESAHAQLVDGLWRRASAEVDREIEQARARGRQS
jgi:hypothetical protein